ncbi:VOC family protein, partial [Priestia megaterium]|uniref:VOC family protein n=1 Tax=Priestia megaterium TaxID=1404 RepID=UPI0035B5FBE9
WAPESAGMPFRANEGGQYAFRVEDVAAARSALEAKGVQFDAPTVDTGVCHMAMFRDPDGNLMRETELNRYGCPLRDDD